MNGTSLPWWLQWPQTPVVPRISPQDETLIPDTGAARYWYVDPRAQGVPSPSSPSILGAQDENSRTMLEWLKMDREIQREYRNNMRELSANPQQDRPEGYGQHPYSSFPGLLEEPNMPADQESKYKSSIHEIDGKYYILPTRDGWPQNAALDRFQVLGEHWGVFPDLYSAMLFERMYVH